jgi:hypothetical protein
MTLINLMQESMENSQVEEIIRPIQEEINSLSRSTKESTNIILRKDGVLIELIE